MKTSTLSKVFEWVRILGVVTAIYLGYYYAGLNDYGSSLKIFMPIYVISLVGLTGIQLAFFPKGSEYIGRSPDPRYQRQSGMNCLALAIMAVVVAVFSWGKYAEITLVMTAMIFIVLSAIIHAWEIFAYKNRSIGNFLRPILTLAMCAAVIPLLINYFKITP